MTLSRSIYQPSVAQILILDILTIGVQRSGTYPKDWARERIVKLPAGAALGS